MRLPSFSLRGTLSGPLLGLIALLIGFAFLTFRAGELGSWLSIDNFRNNILHKFCIHGLVALGMLLIILSGGIDLSVGSVLALATVVMIKVYEANYSTYQSTFVPSLLAIGAGILTGTLCGAINGLIITRLKLTPFVVTLGMMSIAKGMALWLSNRAPIPIPTGEGRPGWVDLLSQPSQSPVFFDPGIWCWILLSIFMIFVLRQTVFGRYCYAIGSNEATARLCGINVEWSRFKIYCIAGTLTGLAGIIRFAQGNGGDPNTGQLLELEVIAAVIIGGAALTGGKGTVTGTVLGVLIYAVIDNSICFLEVIVEMKYMLIGIAVIANTALASRSSR